MIKEASEETKAAGEASEVVEEALGIIRVDVAVPAAVALEITRVVEEVPAATKVDEAALETIKAGGVVSGATKEIEVVLEILGMVKAARVVKRAVVCTETAKDSKAPSEGIIKADNSNKVVTAVFQATKEGKQTSVVVTKKDKA